MPPDPSDCRIVVHEGAGDVAFVDAGSSNLPATLTVLGPLIRRLPTDAIVTVRGETLEWAGELVAWTERTELAVEALATIPQASGVIVTLRRCPPSDPSSTDRRLR